MAIRTLNEIIDSAIDFIKSKRPGIATFSGSVTRDVVIETPAQEFDRVFQEIERTQKLQSTVFATEMTSEELDALGANYGLTRLSGRAASGEVTFQIRNFSTSSDDVTVPVGTVVSTQSSGTQPKITFVTTETLLFSAASAPSFFNPETGLYEQTADVVAQEVGTAGNVAANTIVKLNTSISGISSVTNELSTTGGTDEEDNEAFGLRIQQKLSGNNIGTVAGINSFLAENVNVVDSEIVTPNDPEMLRDEFGGEVDVYILGEIISTISDVFTYEATGSQEFILFHPPVRSLVSVTGIVGGSAFTFVEGVDFNFVPDTSTLLNGSIRLEPKIVFDIGGTNPDDASNLTVTYTYNSLIEDLQVELDKDENKIVTSDILVKEATEATIDIEADVALFPGNIEADAISAIQTEVSTFINNLALGDSIDRSDIVSVIEDSGVVDQVDLSTLSLSKDTVPLPAAEQRLDILKTEFPRTGTVSINII